RLPSQTRGARDRRRAATVRLGPPRPRSRPTSGRTRLSGQAHVHGLTGLLPLQRSAVAERKGKDPQSDGAPTAQVAGSGALRRTFRSVPPRSRATGNIWYTLSAGVR